MAKLSGCVDTFRELLPRRQAFLQAPQPGQTIFKVEDFTVLCLPSFLTFQMLHLLFSADDQTPQAPTQ